MTAGAPSESTNQASSREARAAMGPPSRASSGRRSSVGGDDHVAAVALTEAAERRDTIDSGPGAYVVDQDQRAVRPLPADAARVRSEVLDDREVVGVALRRWWRHDGSGSDCSPAPVSR